MKEESALPGSYRLAGMMETASQLLLEADGSYKWMMIVGSLDLYSEGRWTKADSQVILGPHRFNKDTPVFALGKSYAWDREERDVAHRMESIRLKNRAKWKCAFLESGGIYGSSGESAFPRDLPVTQQFEAAVTIERDRYNIYQKAIVAYFDRDTANADDRLEIAARTAKQEWEHAVAYLAESGRAAGKAVQYQPPSLPAECLYLSDYTPEYSVDADQYEVNWNRGAGIWIGRRDRPNARLKVDAQFSFTDGRIERASSYELGFAFTPLDKGRQLQSIRLTLDHNETEYSSKFDVAADSHDHVYEVKLDNRLFIKPPFEELRLDISGDRLMSVDGSRGYYLKRK
ncbi:MAG: hypothetical protein AB8B54_07390 [Sphingorhabdus sp.]